jgi:energy-coupling factor transporter ATP-binding protein EcfA2
VGFVQEHPTGVPAAEIKKLADLCEAEASGQLPAPLNPPAVGSLAHLPAGQSLRIERVTNIKGVNALHPSATLDAAKASMLVVYGENGAGKSGFARLIKHACGDRLKTPLLPDVFVASPPAPAGDITTTLNGTPTTATWTEASGPLPSLRYTHVFDTQTAATYLRDKSAATYQPRRMMLISSLIQVSDLVSGELAARKKGLPKALPELPIDLLESPPAAIVKSLKATTPSSEIDAACTLTEQMKAERLNLEILLANKDTKKRQEEIARRLAAISRAEKEMAALRQGLSDQELGAVAEARATARMARTAATDGARIAFSDAPLSGVGSDTWIALWKQARAYSEADPYRGRPFPVVEPGSRCVLCQQELDPGGRKRLSRFEEFVRGGLEATARQKEEALDKLLKALPSVPRREDWQLRANTLGMNESAADALLVQAESRHAFVLSGDSTSTAPALDWSPLETSSAALAKRLEDEAKLLQDSLEPTKRAEMTARLLQLRCTEWLSSQRAALKAEVARLQKIAQLSKAESLARTNALTSKQNELAEHEVEAGYKQRFVAELKLLGGPHLPVELKGFQEGKGRVSFQLALKSAAKDQVPQHVLSEGEARIVALSAFLADITAPGGSAPFIFDDPVSSLDHMYEERVASRLLELAKSRQVIVFTHRLSFVTLLQDTFDRAKKGAEAGGVPWNASQTVTTLRRLGKNIGLPGGLSVRDSKPHSAMNKLKNEALAKLRNLEKAGDVAGYEEAHSAYCADFRIVLESTIELVLLRNIVGRFRRDVQTKGKIAQLSKITTEDCALFDDLMTQYSTQEHAQPDELPAKLKSVEELEADASQLVAWLAAHPKT